MAWHTIEEAQKLTGKSRRTLYRDMASGHVSWEIESDGRRRLETSELIRAYGVLKDMAQLVPEETAHDGTTIGTQEVGLIMAELKMLREEIAELRKTVHLIEHKPSVVPGGTDDTAEKVPETQQLLRPWWKRWAFRQ